MKFSTMISIQIFVMYLSAYSVWIVKSYKFVFTVFLCCFVRFRTNELLVDEVDLIDIKPTYARVRYQGGRDSTDSLNDRGPCRPLAIESKATTLHEENAPNILGQQTNLNLKQHAV